MAFMREARTCLCAPECQLRTLVVGCASSLSSVSAAHQEVGGAGQPIAPVHACGQEQSLAAWFMSSCSFVVAMPSRHRNRHKGLEGPSQHEQWDE
jgi:hypothetical protein